MRSGSALVGALLTVESVIFLGWFVMLFLMTFRREPGVEHDARLRLQRDAERQSLPKRPPRGIAEPAPAPLAPALTPAAAGLTPTENSIGS